MKIDPIQPGFSAVVRPPLQGGGIEPMRVLERRLRRHMDRFLVHGPHSFQKGRGRVDHQLGSDSGGNTFCDI